MKTYVLQALLLTLAVAVVRAANTGVFYISIEQTSLYTVSSLKNAPSSTLPQTTSRVDDSD